MRRNIHGPGFTGFTLIELLTVISIVAIFAAIAGPEIFKTIQSDAKVKSAARTLIADLKSAQNEAVRRGGGEMSAAGVLVRKSAFVLFPVNTNTYQAFHYTDTNGDNIREVGDDVIESIGPVKTLPNSVRFGATADVTKRACQGTATEAPQAVGMSFLTESEPPCVSGSPCLEMDGNGFPIGGNTGGGTIYFTNDKYNYAVNINAAGNFTMCKWPQGATAWIIIR